MVALDKLILSFGSLIYLMILIIVFFSKKRHLTFQNRLYHYLLITALVLLVVEIVTGLLFEYCSIHLINMIVLRIYWMIRVIWFLLLYYYGICVLKDLNYRCLTATIVTGIFFISYMFVKFDDNLTGLTYNYLPGFAALYVLIYCALLVVVLILFLIFQARDATLRKKTSMFILCLEMVIILTFQFQFDYNI